MGLETFNMKAVMRSGTADGHKADREWYASSVAIIKGKKKKKKEILFKEK